MKKDFFIFVILILSLAVRLTGINFGLPLELHPDEGRLIYPANSMAVHFMDSLQGWGDTAFFNPHMFYYGGFSIYLMMFLIKSVSFTLGGFGLIDISNIGYAFALARITTTFFGVLTVYIVYLLTKKLVDIKAGLISALFIAFFPTHVILSHYLSPDIIAAFFGILCVYLLFSGKFYLSAIALGLGVGTKYYPATLVLLIIPYCLFTVKETILSRLSIIFRIGIISLAFFLLTNPHVVLSFPEFFSDMQSQFLRNSGGIMGAVSPRFLYLLVNDDTSSMGKFFGNSLFSDLGPFSLIMVIFSLIAGFVNQNKKIRFLSIFSIFYFCFVSFPISKEMRWLTFEFPILAVLAGSFVTSFKRVNLTYTLTVLLLIYPLSKSIISAAAFAKGDTRTEAIKWVEDNLPKNSTIISDHIQVARAPFDSDKFHVIEILHNKYNTGGIFETERPFDLSYQSKPFYMVTNEKYYDYYTSSDFISLFPQLSQKWLLFYSKITSELELIKCFKSFESDIVPFTGPDICVYRLDD